MRLDKMRQWVGAVYAEDLELMREMLAEDPSLSNSLHAEFDDPFRSRRFPVTTLLFAVNGPPYQQVRWDRVEREINVDMVELLIEWGADVNLPCVYGVPLCYVRDEKMVRYLIDHGAQLDESGALGVAVWRTDPERLRMLIRLGASPHVKVPRTGESMLDVAVLSAGAFQPMTDELEILKILLENGVDPNTRTESGIRSNSRKTPDLHGHTSLLLAVQCADDHLVEPMVKLLLSFNADRSLRTDEGETALQLAEERGLPDSILNLLE